MDIFAKMIAAILTWAGLSSEQVNQTMTEYAKVDASTLNNEQLVELLRKTTKNLGTKTLMVRSRPKHKINYWKEASHSIKEPINGQTMEDQTRNLSVPKYKHAKRHENWNITNWLPTLSKSGA